MVSILPPEQTGVHFIAGFPGVGKSYLMAQLDLPKNIAFFDFEKKGEGLDRTLNFGYYRALTQEVVDKPGEALFQLAMDTVNELEQGKYTVLALDNIKHLEMSIQADVVKNRTRYAERFGLDARKIASNSWGHQQACKNNVVAQFCENAWSKGIKLIAATVHVKSQWFGGQPVPGKYRYPGANRWQELSTLTLVLQRGKYAPIPEAIVIKEQLGTIGVNENPTQEELEAMMRGDSGHTIQRRLPFKIPKCTAQQIRWYLANPVDIDNLSQEESLTKEDRDAFDEKLSDAQLGFIMRAMDIQEEEEKKALEYERELDRQEKIPKIKVDLESGKPFPIIAKKYDVDIAFVQEVKKGM